MELSIRLRLRELERGSLIWAGSDTGLIHITRDGGKTWKDITPKGLGGDWSKISLIEASHFDPARKPMRP